MTDYIPVVPTVPDPPTVAVFVRDADVLAEIAADIGGILAMRRRSGVDAEPEPVLDLDYNRCRSMNPSLRVGYWLVRHVAQGSREFEILSDEAFHKAYQHAELVEAEIVDPYADIQKIVDDDWPEAHGWALLVDQGHDVMVLQRPEQSETLTVGMAAKVLKAPVRHA